MYISTTYRAQDKYNHIEHYPRATNLTYYTLNELSFTGVLINNFAKRTGDTVKEQGGGRQSSMVPCFPQVQA